MVTTVITIDERIAAAEARVLTMRELVLHVMDPTDGTMTPMDLLHPYEEACATLALAKAAADA